MEEREEGTPGRGTCVSEGVVVTACLECSEHSGQEKETELQRWKNQVVPNGHPESLAPVLLAVRSQHGV